MSLLEFARGPALWVAIAVCLVGSVWRVIGIFLMKSKPDLSEPRGRNRAAGALSAIVGRMLPKQEFMHGTALVSLNAYVYHIGLAIVVFAYLPHVNFIKRLTGISWPVPPTWVFYVAVPLTLVSLLIAIIHRLTDPVRRLLSNFDDYFSWIVVFLPMLTGMAALGDVSSEIAPGVPLYPVPVAVHLLSVELLLIWLPFGKLAHTFLVFLSRGVTGAAFARKGAAT